MCDSIKTMMHLLNPSHLRHMKPHTRHFKHVVRPQRVPGVHHTIMAKGNRQARRNLLGNTGHPATFWIGVMPTLQGDVD